MILFCGFAARACSRNIPPLRIHSFSLRAIVRRLDYQLLAAAGMFPTVNECR